MVRKGGTRSRNIPLPAGFPARLIQLREERHLARADLAEKAELTYNTIYNLEVARHDSALERTLMQIAKAMEIPFAELLEAPVTQPTALAETNAHRGRSRLRYVAVSAAIALLALAGGGCFVWHEATSNARFELIDKSLVVRDALFGSHLWTLRSGAQVNGVLVAPWDENILVAGLASRSVDGGRVLGLDRRTGRVVWECTPDLDQLARAMGDDVMSGAGMGTTLLRPLDVDGDDEMEILARFLHGRNHPTALCLIGRDGTLLRQYSHKGHIMDVLVDDLDGDGKDEVLAGGVNNAPALNGPTLFMLDDLHWRGASVDSLTNPWSSEPDSCLYRMMLPAFPKRFHAVMGDSRLAACMVRTGRQPDGDLYISFFARGNRDILQSTWVLCDSQLRVVRAMPEDSFLQVIENSWPDSLRSGPDPSDAGWCADWLSNAKYAGVGYSSFGGSQH